MRRALCFAVVVAAGCFQPVDPNVPVISSCRGEACPYGPCDHACTPVDGGCNSPECALCVYSGQRACVAYTADRFQAEPPATPCATVPGSYCVITAGTVQRRLAVECLDAGQSVTECSQVDPCQDGGSSGPEICRRACGKQYCVR